MRYKTFFIVAFSLLLFSSPVFGKVELGDISTNWITYQVNVNGTSLNVAECVDFLKESKIRIVAHDTQPVLSLAFELDKPVTPNSVIKVDIDILHNKKMRTIKNVRFESNEVGDTLVIKNQSIALDVARCLHKKQNVSFTIKNKKKNGLLFYIDNGVEYALSPLLKNFK